MVELIEKSYHALIEISIDLVGSEFEWSAEKKKKFEKLIGELNKSIVKKPFENRKYKKSSSGPHKKWETSDINCLNELNELNTPIFLMALRLNRTEGAVKNKLKDSAFIKR